MMLINQFMKFHGICDHCSQEPGAGQPGYLLWHNQPQPRNLSELSHVTHALCLGSLCWRVIVVSDSEHAFSTLIHILYNILYIIRFVFMSRTRIWCLQMNLWNSIASLTPQPALFGNPEPASRNSLLTLPTTWSPRACSLWWRVIAVSHCWAHRLRQRAHILVFSQYFI